MSDQEPIAAIRPRGEQIRERIEGGPYDWLKGHPCFDDLQFLLAEVDRLSSELQKCDRAFKAAERTSLQYWNDFEAADAALRRITNRNKKNKCKKM